MKKSIVILAIVLIGATFTVQADTIWDEGVDGALSVDGNTPTMVTLVSTSDLVIGAAVSEHNYFTFNVPGINTVDSFIVDPSTGGLAFFNLYGGATSGGTPLCGGGVSRTTNLLDGGTCPGLTSLPAGDYTIELFNLLGLAWIVEIDSTVPVELMSFTVE